jgi:hypothetical protein
MSSDSPEDVSLLSDRFSDRKVLHKDTNDDNDYHGADFSHFSHHNLITGTALRRLLAKHEAIWRIVPDVFGKKELAN